MRNHGETVREYNPRFLQYARWRGMTPEAVLAADEEEYPGGKMVGFILWNGNQTYEWCQENGIDRHWAGLHFDEISERIEIQLKKREKSNRGPS